MRKFFIALFAFMLLGASCSSSDDSDDITDLDDAVAAAQDIIGDDPINDADEATYEDLAKEIIYGALEEQGGQPPPDISGIVEPLATQLETAYYLPSNTIEEYERKNENVSSCYWRGAANGLLTLTLQIVEHPQSGLTPGEIETVKSVVELGRTSLNIDADFECLALEQTSSH